MVVEVECMDELGPVGKALLKAIFVIAYLSAFRISEYLISDDELKWLTLDIVSFEVWDDAFRPLQDQEQFNGPISGSSLPAHPRRCTLPGDGSS